MVARPRVHAIVYNGIRDTSRRQNRRLPALTSPEARPENALTIRDHDPPGGRRGPDPSPQILRPPRDPAGRRRTKMAAMRAWRPSPVRPHHHPGTVGDCPLLRDDSRIGNKPQRGRWPQPNLGCKGEFTTECAEDTETRTESGLTTTTQRRHGRKSNRGGFLVVSSCRCGYFLRALRASARIRGSILPVSVNLRTLPGF